jgi:hypothetical protein
MSLAGQTRLLDGEIGGRVADIQTSGRVIKPALAPLTAINDECRLHVRPEGLTVRVCDPANVALVEWHVNAATAFEGYEVHEPMTIGLPVDKLNSALSAARIGTRTDDDVHLELSTGHVGVDVTREYDGSTLTKSSEFLTVEADALREDADLDALPDPEEFAVGASCSSAALQAGIKHVATGSDPVAVRADGGDDLHLASERDTTAGAVTMHDAVDQWNAEETQTALFSPNYLRSIAEALGDTKADNASLYFQSEFPALLPFIRKQDGEELYRGTFGIAPRISDGDSP